MNTQFEYLQQLAQQYLRFNEDPSSFFEALKNLSKEQLEDIFQEYSNPERKFQPVNLIRSEIARRLLEGHSISPEYVEKIKTQIR